MRNIAGTAKVVPCGVSKTISLTLATPAGNAAVPAPPGAMVSAVGCDSAPGGTTRREPFGPSSVPPAAPMVIVTAAGGSASS